jgi:hypothetical protein
MKKITIGWANPPPKKDATYSEIVTDIMSVDMNRSSNQTQTGMSGTLYGVFCVRGIEFLRESLANRSFHLTRHVVERADKYLREKSMGSMRTIGYNNHDPPKYPEIHAEEHEVITSLLEFRKYLWGHLDVTQVVEVGFNKQGDWCKTAYVVPFETVNLADGKPRNRFLFFALGNDGGLKTVNIHPLPKIPTNVKVRSVENSKWETTQSAEGDLVIRLGTLLKDGPQEGGGSVKDGGVPKQTA